MMELDKGIHFSELARLTGLTQESSCDLTWRYKQLFPHAHPHLATMETWLKEYSVIFVPGYMGDLINRVNRQFFRESSYLSYFKEQCLWLGSHGVGFEILPTGCQQPPHENVPILLQTLEDLFLKTGKKAILVGHSKGGLDILTALLLEPEIRNYVGGWISIQTPYRGTPLADWFVNHRIPKWLSMMVLPFLNGEVDGIYSMEQHYRKSHLSLYQEYIKNILSVPMLSFASCFSRHVSLYRKSALQEMDGIVPAASAILPGSCYVLLAGISHHATVLRFPGTRFDRPRFLKTLLLLLREVMEGKLPEPSFEFQARENRASGVLGSS